MEKFEIFEEQRALLYDQFVETWIPNYAYFISLLPNMLDEYIHEEVLVVGCGTGNEISKLVHHFADWKITGVDPSPQMLQQARNKLHDFKNISLKNGVVSDLDNGQKYSAATLLLVLHFLKDNGEKLETLSGISNRLKPGATFIILDITGESEQIKENLSVLQQILPKDLPEDEIKFRMNRIETELFTVSENRLITLLDDADFEKPVRFFQSTIYKGWITKKKNP